ncbi:acetylornithine deacetylase [Paracoccaceae bacterium]|nr:acetylornithine deacetylase [Paracoccaceae bacterium]
MQYEEMLASLVEFPTVAGTSNAALIDFIRHYLAKHGVAAQIIAGPEQDRFNLFATIGPADTPGFVLSGHLDVVPAGELGWRADPFKLRRENGCLIGRGAVDMKGYVAAVLSAVPQLVGMGLKQPLHIALSYDEEVGCRGVPYLIDKLPSLCALPLGCFVGEPSGMIPVLRHKGKATLALRAKGTSGHSSRPELGTNAIHALLPVLSRAAALPDELQRTGHRHDAFLPPHSTVQIGIVEGGQSVNTIPDHARALIEARAVPGEDPQDVLAVLMVMAETEDRLTAEIVATYPALDLDSRSDLARLAAELTGSTPIKAVSYGTEAGLFQQAGIASIVCGPGDIKRAHKPEEFITSDELRSAHDFVLRLAQRLN